VDAFKLYFPFSTIFFSMVFPAHSGLRPLFQFRNHFSQTIRLLGRVISPSQGRDLNTGQHKDRINAYTHQNIRALAGIRNYDPRVLADEDSSCFRLRGWLLWPAQHNFYFPTNTGKCYHGETSTEKFWPIVMFWTSHAPNTKIRFLLRRLSVCMYIWMAGYMFASLAHEQWDVFCSYSVFKNLFTSFPCSEYHHFRSKNRGPWDELPNTKWKFSRKRLYWFSFNFTDLLR
jgi:hypothetical protein